MTLRHRSKSALWPTERTEDGWKTPAGTRVTEAVYRHQLRPVLLTGAVAMDRIFSSGKEGPAEA